MTDRIGPRWPLRIGLALEAAGLLAIGGSTEATPIALLGAAMALVGFGAGLFQVPNLALMMAAFPPAQQGAAGGLAFLGRTLGSVVGVQATALLFDARAAARRLPRRLPRGLLAAGLVCVLGGGSGPAPGPAVGPARAPPGERARLAVPVGDPRASASRDSCRPTCIVSASPR